jgi:putative endonuclease
MVGDAMERLAEDYLRRHRLQPVARNHRCRFGEIDLVMRDGATLVFVEVRYRSSDRFGTAAETVDRRKQRRLTAAASHYLQGHPTVLPCRFDVVAVSGEIASSGSRMPLFSTNSPASIPRTQPRRADPMLRREQTRRLVPLILLLLGATLSSGCTPILIGGAAVGAAATLHDRRSASVILDDQQIELEAMSALLRNAAVRDRSQISVTSYNRTLLLTGNADTTEITQEAASSVSRIGKVQRVVDEVTVGPRLDMKRQAEDTYITARVKADLIGVRCPDSTRPGSRSSRTTAWSF